MGGFTEVRVKENGEQEIKGRKWRGTLQKNGRVYLSDTEKLNRVRKRDIE